MENPSAPASVSPEWLAQNLENHDKILVLACHCDPASHNTQKTIELYENLHIPNAILCDVSDLSDSLSPFPHQAPSAEDFIKKIQKLGISPHKHIVCYSFGPIPAAPRIWWLLRLFGFQNVSVLNTSLSSWEKNNFPVSSQKYTPPRPLHEPISVEYQHHLIADHIQVLHAVSQNDDSPKVIDARSKERFFAMSPEPREPSTSGHITGSLNMPFPLVFSQENLPLLPKTRLRQLFAEHYVDPDKPHIFTCGSGVTACVLAWAQASVGCQDSAVYDGSWAHWISDPSRPTSP
jgi:thiosulfate/3-mercaptopyruvate sulfurtransferase